MTADSTEPSASLTEPPAPRGWYEPSPRPSCEFCHGVPSSSPGMTCTCVQQQYKARYEAARAAKAAHKPLVEITFEFEGGRPEAYVEMTTVPLPGEEVVWFAEYEAVDGTVWEDTQTYVVRTRRWAIHSPELAGTTQPSATLELDMAPSRGDAPCPTYAPQPGAADA